MTDTSTHRWSEGAIVYQIYPRSFQDSNGDGIGDIPGVISRLDYLKRLGINAIWLSPFYPSPMADFGYDVADYCDVDPMFGTLDDFKQLVLECNSRNIKILVDLVPNHTSTDHKWFTSSRTNASGNYADWYIWHDAKTTEDGTKLPPNNWLNIFSGGSAWEWDDSRQQYYLHSFDKGQPDLNWENPAVRSAMQDVMRFWLDLGVAGFRVDAVYWIGKNPELTDNPVNPDYVEGVWAKYDTFSHINSRGWSSVYGYLSELANVLKEPAYIYKSPFMVTEAYPDRHNPVASYMAFYENIDPTVSAPFNFEGLSLPWEAEPWRVFLDSFHHTLETFNEKSVASYAFGNHDQARLRSRLGEARARSAAVMSFTLPGMIFVYNGEELGLENVSIPADKVHDPAAVGGEGRDPYRTPMQWSADENAGFTTADEPWLPVSDDYTNVNAEVEAQDENSFLNLYTALAKLRNQELVLKTGKIKLIDAGHSDIVGYIRYTNDSDKAFLVLINFSNENVIASNVDECGIRKQVISSLSVADQSLFVDSQINMKPYEAITFSVHYHL